MEQYDLYDNEAYCAHLHEAADFLKERCGDVEIAVVLGSGLGSYAEHLENDVAIPYREIPGFPQSQAPGHANMWHTGTLFGKKVCLMQGRFHPYEGFDQRTVTFPIRVMKLLGIKTVILTNAAGGVNPNMNAGDLMLITDVINLSGKNPLVGPNLDEFGPRFPDMTHPFPKELQKLALDVAMSRHVHLHTGTYVCLSGPSYETPAEIRMVRMLGGDAVGMSTVPEIIVARHCGMKILAISCITNMAAGMTAAELDGEEVIEAGRKAQTYFTGLVDGIIEKL